MRRIKAAVVGVGNIGSIHADIYSTLESVDLTAVCDTDQEKADKAASKFNCKAFYSVESLLAEMPMEIASVCTKGEENGGDHFIPTIQLLDAGYIHLEKNRSQIILSMLVQCNSGRRRKKLDTE
jgi:predicted dehydrogenase